MDRPNYVIQDCNTLMVQVGAFVSLCYLSETLYDNGEKLGPEGILKETLNVIKWLFRKLPYNKVIFEDLVLSQL